MEREESLANIYNRPGAEKQLLSLCSPRIQSFDEIKPTLRDLKNSFEQKKNEFHKELPKRIDLEKNQSNILIDKRDEINQYWNQKIEDINHILTSDKWKFWKYIEVYWLKNISKPKALKFILKDIHKQNEIIQTLQDHPKMIFNKENHELNSEIIQLDHALKSPDYRGAYGELEVLDELKKLDNSYYVFCDAKITLRDYVTYKGNRNLKSAQMDFVVAGPTGFFIIEVKNWSDRTKLNHHGLSPYEQLDRAGLVLWIYLKNRFFIYKPPITKLLVSLKGNFSYNKNYRSVLVKHYKGLNTFIQNNNRVVKESKLHKVVNSLS